jgi:capsid portal protein
MHCILKIVLILGSCSLLSLEITAQEFNKDSRLNCSAKHLDTNKNVEVKTASGLVGKKIATAQWPLGYPTIIIDDSAFLKLPVNTRQFIYYHECAHLKFETTDEYEADCKSLELINKKHDLSEIDVRKLVKTLVQKFGMSRRWSELLQCEEFL